MATTSVYDAFGRMHYAIADSAGASSATRNNRTSYGNDALDRLVSTTMPGGGTSRYAYDTLGRMTSRHHPDADGPVRYKYDDLGRVRFSQDARQRAADTGKVTYTVYDAFGRVTRVGEAAATFSSLDPESSYPFETDVASWRSRMTYDDGDAAGGGPNYAQGRLVKVEENTDSDAAAEVVHHYAYDHLGNVRVKRVSIDGLTADKTVDYDHDLTGRVTRLIYPDGAQARYAYDGAGRLTRVWDAQGKTLAAYTHTAAGNIDTHVVGHGEGDDAGEGIVTGTYTYNPREWVTRIDYPGRFTVNQRYDGAGNVTSQRYRRAASEAFRAAGYFYDRLHRLTGFSLQGGRQTRYYRYDRNGNLRHMRTNGRYTLYAYLGASTPNRVSIVYGGGLLIRTAHNRNGWVRLMADSALTYDYRGLLTGHGTAAYTMDPDRRRVKKTVEGITTYYLRGADGAVLAEYTGQALSARYVYAGSRRIARVAGSGHSYYLADHLGSTRSLVDEAGSVTAAYDYWPYGKVLATSGAESTHFRFTGHERDAEAGLDYMLARSYAYDIGRFLRPDPMQDEYPGISPYAYANNNPLKYVDPDGRRIRLQGGRTERNSVFSLIAKNLTPQERQNVGIKYDERNDEFRVWTTAGYEGTSKAFGYLREVVNHSAYVDIRLSRTVETSKGSKNVSNEYGGGVILLGKEGASSVTISPDGHPYDRAANPDHIIFVHEVLGHGRLHQQGNPEAHFEDKANEVENEIRKAQGLKPKITITKPIEVNAPRYEEDTP